MCGIWGYIGKDKTDFDIKSFLVLGISNDSRGGDSCGIFIDKKFEYGVDKKKFFSSFYSTSKVLPGSKRVQIALGHDRKASVGTIEEKTAQPVVICDNNNQPEFVMIHNGTIANYKALSAKYLKDVPAYYTDSQIMAHIVYYHGFDVLKEYTGAGAFVFVDYRKNKNNPITYIFKGASPATEWSKNNVEERPLYFSLEKTGIWFSSIESSLRLVRYGENSIIKSTKVNTLYVIRNGVIIDNIVYDRSAACQVEKAVYPIVHNSHAHEDYDDYWGGRNRNQTGFRQNNVATVNTPTYKNTNMFDQSMISNLSNKLIFDGAGRYLVNNKLAHGILEVNRLGYLKDPKGVVTYFKIAFFDGLILDNPDSFTILDKVVSYFEMEPSDFIDVFPEIVLEYTYNPIYYKNVKTKEGITVVDEGFLYLGRSVNTMEVAFANDYDGIFTVLFNTGEQEYVISNGKIKNARIFPYGNEVCFNKFMDFSNSVKLNVEAEVADHIKILSSEQTSVTN